MGGTIAKQRAARRNTTTSSATAPTTAVLSSSSSSSSPRLLALLKDHACATSTLPSVLVHMIYAYVGPIVTEWQLPKAFHAHGPYEDRASLLAKLPPLRGPLYAVNMTINWHDQGWGNSKGEVWFRLVRGMTGSSVTGDYTAGTEVATGGRGQLPIAPKTVQIGSYRLVRSAMENEKKTKKNKQKSNDDDDGEHDDDKAGSASWTTADAPAPPASPEPVASVAAPATEALTAPPSILAAAAAAAVATTTTTTVFPPDGDDGAAIYNHSTTSTTTAAAVTLVSIPSPMIDKGRHGDVIEIWYSVGGGGGHQLFIKQLHITVECIL